MLSTAVDLGLGLGSRCGCGIISARGYVEVSTLAQLATIIYWPEPPKNPSPAGFAKRKIRRFMFKRGGTKEPNPRPAQGFRLILHMADIVCHQLHIINSRKGQIMEANNKRHAFRQKRWVCCYSLVQGPTERSGVRTAFFHWQSVQRVFGRANRPCCGACSWNCSQPLPDDLERMNIGFGAGGAGGLHSTEN